MKESGDRPGVAFVALHCCPVMPLFLADRHAWPTLFVCLRFVSVFRLHWVFTAGQAFSSCGAGRSHCGDFSCCRARALELRLSNCVTRT